MLLVHAVLVAWIAFRTSPTLDELGHLPAGLYSWRFGRFDVYRVNPPLVRTWAALPVVLSGPELRWSNYRDGPGARPEWNLGREFIAANDRGDRRWLWYFIIARWTCIPLSVIGGFVCWRWAGELYGPAAGLLALTLWCFCPKVLAWAATIGPDAGAAAMGVAAAYLYWRWLREPTWARAVAAGAGLGLALLTKTTWIVLFAVWPLLWVVWCGAGRKGAGAVFGRRPATGTRLPLKTTPDPVALNRTTPLRLGLVRFIRRPLSTVREITVQCPLAPRGRGQGEGAESASVISRTVLNTACMVAWRRRIQPIATSGDLPIEPLPDRQAQREMHQRHQRPQPRQATNQVAHGRSTCISATVGSNNVHLLHQLGWR